MKATPEIPGPCIFCDRNLTTGWLYFNLHAGPACARCVEQRDLYDEIVIVKHHYSRQSKTA